MNGSEGRIRRALEAAADPPSSAPPLEMVRARKARLTAIHRVGTATLVAALLVGTAATGIALTRLLGSRAEDGREVTGRNGSQAQLPPPDLLTYRGLVADDARTGGTVAEEEGCIFLRRDGGDRTLLIWPQGATAERRPGGAVAVRYQGEVIALEGEDVVMSGVPASLRSPDEWRLIDDSVPARCKKQSLRAVWLVGVQIETPRGSFILGAQASENTPSDASAPSGVAWIRVPEGIELRREKPNYVRYEVATSNPTSWTQWFINRYPVGSAPTGWTYCGGGNAPRDMSRSWSRGEEGLLLNVNFMPREGEVWIMVLRGRFDDCEHRE